MNSKDRVLVLFFRALRGEWISVSRAADEFSVSSKTVSRDLSLIKSFLADNRELVGNTELQYDYSRREYYLDMDGFLNSREALALIEILIGSRALTLSDTQAVTDKIKRFTTPLDRSLLDKIIKKEIYHFDGVAHDSEDVLKTLFSLAEYITQKREITLTYYKMNRDCVRRRVCPLSIMFTDYYFYLIAFRCDDEKKEPRFFRVDRISEITTHRKQFSLSRESEFDEGELRRLCPFMLPGKKRKISFEFSGPSVQAILDRLPTAEITKKLPGGKYLIDAEVYGDGIKMYLLSQGAWVKVISPKELADEIKTEAEKIARAYTE